MKQFVLPLAVFAAMTLALSTAATASADETGYFTALTDYGYGDTTQDVALNVGYSICQDVSDGVPRQTTIDAIYDSTNEDVDSADAAFLYDAALGHLC